MWPHLMLIGLRMAIQSNTDAHNDDRSNYGASFLISVSHCHFRVCLRGIYLHVWRSWAKETYSVATVEWQTEWYSNARNLNEMLRREGDILILPLHLLSPPTPTPISTFSSSTPCTPFFCTSASVFLSFAPALTTDEPLNAGVGFSFPCFKCQPNQLLLLFAPTQPRCQRQKSRHGNRLPSSCF